MIDPRWRTGHVPNLVLDPTESRYRDHPELAGAAILPSDDVDMRSEMPAIRQQIAQDCVDHAVSALARVIALVLGTPLPWNEDPSVLHLYAIARLKSSPHTPLIDNGSILRSTFEAVMDQGLVPESAWPEIPENIDVIPPDDVWRDGESVTISAFHRLSDGRSSSEEIRAGLRRRRASTICLRVDERFANIGADVYSATGGRVIGSHCMLVVGYVTSIRAFIVRNSWGPDFGDLGYCLVHEDIVDRLSYEKYTFDVAPVVR